MNDEARLAEAKAQNEGPPVDDRTEPGPDWFNKILGKMNKRLTARWIPRLERWGIFHDGFLPEPHPDLVWVCEDERGGYVSLESGYIQKRLQEMDRIKFQGRIDPFLEELARIEAAYNRGEPGTREALKVKRRELAEMCRDWVLEMARQKEEALKYRESQKADALGAGREALQFVARDPVTIISPGIPK